MVASAQLRYVSNWNGAAGAAIPSGLAGQIQKATEGLTYADPTFAANWKASEVNGIGRGAYHFVHPALDPVAQAKYFVATVKARGLKPGDMLWADVEILSGGRLRRLVNRLMGRAEIMAPGTVRNNLPVRVVPMAVVNSAAKTFLDTVRALVPAGVIVGIYTDLSVGATLTSCTGYPLWIAWPSSTAPASVAPWKHWTLWQWGSVNGIDRDAFNGTLTDFADWVASHVVPAKTWQEWRTLGYSSLDQVAGYVGMAPSTVLRTTAVHYGAYDAVMAQYLNDLADGRITCKDPIPAGAQLWVLK